MERGRRIGESEGTDGGGQGKEGDGERMRGERGRQKRKI